MTTIDERGDAAAESGEPAMPTGASPSRRDLFNGLGIGAATVAVIGTGAGSYRVSDTRALDPGSGAAILAANPHNAQSWRFAVADASIDLYADTTRNTGIVDRLRREMYADLTLLPDTDSTHVAHLGTDPGARD